MVKKIKASGCNVLLIQKSILRDAVTDLSLHSLIDDISLKRAALSERFGDLFGSLAVSPRLQDSVACVNEASDVDDGELHRARLRIGDRRRRLEELMYEMQCDAAAERASRQKGCGV